MKTCAWCSNDFVANVTYQIYCCAECRNLATKEKIAERSSVNKLKNRSKKQRKCAGECGAFLSIYNDNGFCAICMTNKKKVEKMLKELKGLFDYEQS